MITTCVYHPNRTAGCLLRASCSAGHPILRECIRRVGAMAQNRAQQAAKHQQLSQIFALSSAGGQVCLCVGCLLGWLVVWPVDAVFIIYL